MNGFEDVDCKDYFAVSSAGLRKHELKLFKGRFNATYASFFLKCSLQLSVLACRENEIK